MKCTLSWKWVIWVPILVLVLIGGVPLSAGSALTQDRAGYVISGYVKPDVESTQANFKEKFKVSLEGTAYEAYTDSNGYFELLQVPANSTGYNLLISKDQYLLRRIDGLKVSGNVTLSSQGTPIDLWAGDLLVNGVQNGIINMEDVLVIAQSFNTVSGDTKYNSNTDLNADQVVNMADVMILVKHFNKSTQDYPPVEIVVPSVTPTPVPTPTKPANQADELKITYTTSSDNGSTYTGTITVENPNKTYAWNGKMFALRDFSFVTTSNITSASMNDGGVIITEKDGRTYFDLGWLSMFPLGQKQVITIEAQKSGNVPFPQDFKSNYVRADDIVYPEYQGLPSTWYKGKTDLKISDLIANTQDYYNTSVAPVKDKVIVYQPYHKTQIWIGQPNLTKLINETPSVRIWIPSRYMAMGLAFNYEIFKLNPNFLVALGTKENFACGILHESTGIDNGHKITVDGQTYYWPFVAMADGPFQQEAQNFNDCKDNYPDYLSANANHPDFCQTTTSTDDPAFVSSAITCGISLTITREHLNAVKGVEYKSFMEQAKDPWAEYCILDYGYNMGVDEIFKAKVFGSRRQEALNAARIDEVLGLVGDSGHVQEVRGALEDINNDTQRIYDAKITWSDMENYMNRIRMFYAQGVPADSEWTAMKEDVKRAFDILAQHWDGSSVSFKYDFLTLLRVMKAYQPAPYTPRPAGENWYYIITGQTVD